MAVFDFSLTLHFAVHFALFYSENHPAEGYSLQNPLERNYSAISRPTERSLAISLQKYRIINTNLTLNNEQLTKITEFVEGMPTMKHEEKFTCKKLFH